VQEAAFHRHGFASAAEVLFFRNAFGLPLFLLQPHGLLHHVRDWTAPSVGGLPWPRVWVLLAANLVFDYACKVVMTRLIARAGALHATLALTAQKFTAFGVSVLLLEPSLRLSPRLWLGAAAVLTGTVAYTKASANAMAGPACPVSKAEVRAGKVGEGREEEEQLGVCLHGRTQPVSAAARKKEE
jgi:drug/metabolite transporter (DMT)-like permease